MGFGIGIWDLGWDLGWNLELGWDLGFGIGWDGMGMGWDFMRWDLGGKYNKDTSGKINPYVLCTVRANAFCKGN